MNLQNFCQRGGLALLALGATGYAGLATLRPAPALAPPLVPAMAVPRAEAVAAPLSPVIAVAATAPAPEPLALSPPVAATVSVPVNAPVMAQSAAPQGPVQLALVTRCPMPTAVLAPSRPFRHVWEPRSHRWSRANERGRSTTHAARAEAAPGYPVYDRLQVVPYAARGWSYRRVD